jgi:tRNA (guanine37-N1)-methyltransferase
MRFDRSIRSSSGSTWTSPSWRRPPLVLDVFTLFPEWFSWFFDQRHVSNALRLGHDLRLFNYRDTTPLGNGQVDDSPYGGGAGMVIRVDVVDAALQAVYGPDTEAMLAGRHVAVLAASGRQLDDALAEELAGLETLTLLCGRYEGVDERVRERLANDSISIGPYVLSGGELAAMVVADAVFRKLPGTLGHAESSLEESFSALLAGGPEYPHYTRPAVYRGWEVPEVLLSGHHEEVRKWRLETAAKRRAEAS